MSIRAGRWTVPVSRPEKVLFPRDGITKLDLAEHYARVAPLMLPLTRGRPVAMERFPDGLGGPRFYHKNVRSVPDWVRTETVGKKGGELTQVVCDNAATLVWMADQASITPHLWLSRTDRPQHPDQLIFDLDPPEGRFAEARRVALVVRELLDELGLPSYPKTTGGKGIHVMVPLDRRADYGKVREFAAAVGEVLVNRDPKRLTMEFRKANRDGRLSSTSGATPTRSMPLRPMRCARETALPLRRRFTGARCRTRDCARALHHPGGGRAGGARGEPVGHAARALADEAAAAARADAMTTSGAGLNTVATLD